LDDWWFCESQDMTKSIWCTELPRPILRNIAKNRLNRCVPGPARAMQWAFQLYGSRPQEWARAPFLGGGDQNLMES
jgi:hypothetical protein